MVSVSRVGLRILEDCLSRELGAVDDLIRLEGEVMRALRFGGDLAAVSVREALLRPVVRRRRRIAKELSDVRVRIEREAAPMTDSDRIGV